MTMHNTKASLSCIVFFATVTHALHELWQWLETLSFLLFFNAAPNVTQHCCIGHPCLQFLALLVVNITTKSLHVQWSLFVRCTLSQT